MSQQTEGRNVMIHGRIVWTSGDLFKGRQKIDQNTKQPRMNQQGLPMMEYGFGLAVPKSELQPGRAGAALWAAMHEEAYLLYPSRQLPPQFAMKYKDGDGVDHNGQPFGSREGYAGHIVFSMTTALPIKFYRFENGVNMQIDQGIKCGDYVEVQVNVKAHGAFGQGKPGLYLNPNAVRFLAWGAEIVNTPSGDQIFGAQGFQGALPPGASLTPIASAQPMPSQMPAQQVPPAYGQPAAPQPVVQPAPVQPHYGVVPQQFQPQAPVGNGLPPQPGYAPTPVPVQPYGSPQAGYASAPPATPTALPQNAGMPPIPR